MTSYLIFIGAIVFLIIIFDLLNRKRKGEIFPFEKKQYFLTNAETDFFEILLKIINDRYFIFPQIHLASILQVKKGEFDKKDWKRYFNKLIQKSFDFVIFDRKTLKPLLVIELDDSTHKQQKRMDRDSFVDGALKGADLKILHIKQQNNYDIEALSTQILVELQP